MKKLLMAGFFVAAAFCFQSPVSGALAGQDLELKNIEEATRVLGADEVTRLLTKNEEFTKFLTSNTVYSEIAEFWLQGKDAFFNGRELCNKTLAEKDIIDYLRWLIYVKTMSIPIDLDEVCRKGYRDALGYLFKAVKIDTQKTEFLLPMLIEQEDYPNIVILLDRLLDAGETINEEIKSMLVSQRTGFYDSNGFKRSLFKESISRFFTLEEKNRFGLTVEVIG